MLKIKSSVYICKSDYFINDLKVLVVQFSPWLKFYFPLGKLMYENK